MFHNIQTLTVDPAALQQLLAQPMAVSRWVALQQAARKVAGGVVNLSQGKSQRRVYHTVNSAPKELRSTLRLNGMPLAEIDVKSCQPVLLLTLCPPDERERFKAVLKDDVYKLGGANRERAKTQFQKFAFGGNDQNCFARAIAREFPGLTAAIRGFDGSLAAHLQDVEAEICIYGAGAKLAAADIFFVGIHDGFLVQQKDVELACDVMRAAFRNRIPDFEVGVGQKFYPTWRAE